MPVETASIYKSARRRLRALLAMNEMTQEDLARMMGKAGSTLSSRINRDQPKVFEDISDSFPPALKIVQDLYLDLASAFGSAYDEHMDGLAHDIEESVAGLDLPGNGRK